MEIIQERLEREFDLDLVTTAPSVVYHVNKTDGTQVSIDNPTNLPPITEIASMEEPYVDAHVISPADYVGAIMDLGLPDMDGVDVIRKIRSWSNMPIIVISARTEDSDKIEALDAGADDYLTKPFSVEELLARLRVTQRRLALMKTDFAQESPVFMNGALKIDYAAGCAFLDGEELHLTPIEYKLLCLLSRNVGRVLTHTYITQQIWGSSWENDVASLRVFMATLRKKLERGGKKQQYIQTHIGIGYRMLKVD